MNLNQKLYMYKLFYLYIITFLYITFVNGISYKHKHTESKTADIFNETPFCNGPPLGQFSMCTDSNSTDIIHKEP